MWWFLKKQKEDDSKIVYAYGAQTKECTGEIEFNKETKMCNVLTIADGDTEKGAKWLLPHFYRIVLEENAPLERQIAIG